MKEVQPPDSEEIVEKFESLRAECERLESTLNRELIIPLGHTGSVALFEIVDSRTVTMGAIRHQREDDYH